MVVKLMDVPFDFVALVERSSLMRAVSRGRGSSESGV